MIILTFLLCFATENSSGSPRSGVLTGLTMSQLSSEQQTFMSIYTMGYPAIFCTYVGSDLLASNFLRELKEAGAFNSIDAAARNRLFDLFGVNPSDLG